MIKKFNSSLPPFNSIIISNMNEYSGTGSNYRQRINIQEVQVWVNGVNIAASENGGSAFFNSFNQGAAYGNENYPSSTNYDGYNSGFERQASFAINNRPNKILHPQLYASSKDEYNNDLFCLNI